MSSGGKSSATSTVLVSGVALGGGVTWIEGAELGRGGTGPLSARETLRNEPEFKRKPRTLDFLKSADLNELEEGLTSSVASTDPSLSLDLLISPPNDGVSRRGADGGVGSDGSCTHNTRVGSSSGRKLIRRTLSDGGRLSAHREKNPSSEDRMMGCGRWDVLVDEDEASSTSKIRHRMKYV